MPPRASEVIDLPAGGWRPRGYQMPLWSYLEGGGRRAIAVWHRRAGKDALMMRWASIAAFERVATYWHMLPEYAQARRAIWDAVNPHTGKRIVDEVFPPAIRQTTREDEMLIKFVNGSTWQLVGSDRVDQLVGSPPAGLVSSEHALADPRAWGLLRPILAENGGWAAFISTPRGRNHFWDLLQSARESPEDGWFTQILDAKTSQAFDQPVLDRELREMIREWGEEEGRRLFEQEYYCSFSAAIRGAYYGALLDAADRDGRIRAVPYDPSLPVVTAWDLGRGDATAIWFAQAVHGEVRLIDYYEATGHYLDHYAGVLRARGYQYDRHILPHDANAQGLAARHSPAQFMRAQGLGRVDVLSRSAVDIGIGAARAMLPRCYFDEARTKRGRECLAAYRSDYNEVTRTLSATPVHDWSSHCADAFRYLALGLRAAPVHRAFGVQVAGFDPWRGGRPSEAILD